ncbi:hypothetical protein [Brumimicrobium aurantiacum]|uniref:Uncharacterized protein n=1 Tax=Brumimicrobium aurantiacum TaxID=1737063 RepID=A0A3E1EWF9_9FLAO|nr:hypothetical protein [Brumimicrobium aurantiacum]RFC53858.1 hypothetical protein DXU93_09930 [Brumimicrobium aurantiacum]
MSDSIEEQELQEIPQGQRINQSVIEKLEKSSIWLKLVGILGVLFGVIGILISLFALFALPVQTIINILSFGILIYVSTLLLNMSINVKSDSFDIANFAKNFVTYWKIIGIVTAIGIALTVLSFLYFATNAPEIMTSIEELQQGQ